MPIATKSKIVPAKDLLSPKLIATLPEGKSEMLLGRIFGIAERIVSRTAPDMKTYEGLGGSFEAVPAIMEGQENKDTIQSGILYLPEGIFETVANVLRETDKDGKPMVKSVAFAFDVIAQKASNPAGYSYKYVQARKPEQNDPLAAMRAELAVGGVAAIADQRAKPPKVKL